MKGFVLVAVMISGCAYVPRQVRLVQPDPGQVSPICIKVEPFSDTRADKRRVGVVRNGFYWPTGSAFTDDDAAQWVATHLKALLAPKDCVPEFELHGRVRELFVDEFFNLQGRMVVTLRVERAQTVLLERDVEASYRQLSHLGSAGEFEETLSKTLKAFGERAFPTVVAAAADARPVPGL